MRKLVLLSWMILPIIGVSQVFKSIDTNEVSVGLHAAGIHFMDDAWNSTYFIPQNSGNSTIRFGEFWIGGFDGSGNLHVAAQISRSVAYDFRPGPVTNDAITAPHYNNVWRVSHNEILNHQANYNTPGYIAPTDILDWPGNGDTLRGEAWQLAPFEDLNLNGVYEPEFGDHPCIRGDEAVYAIYSDQLDEATGPGIGADMMVEFHTMLYAYKSVPGHPYLDSTVFNHTVIHARGLTDFSEVYVGHYIDFDIGHFYDDYLGTDVPRDLFYAYNGNGVDPYYGVDPPAQGVLLLSSPQNAGLSSTMFYTDLTTATGQPLFDEHYYQAMTARWKDSTHLVFNNNNGHAQGGPGTDCNYMYSAGTDPNHPSPSWEEWSANQLPGQRRSVGSSGPFDLDAGDRLEFDYAYVYGRQQFGGPAGGIARLKQVSDLVESWWSQQNYPCSSLTIGNVELDEPTLKIYPNPAHDRVNIVVNRPARAQWSLVSIDGRVLKQGHFDGLKGQIDVSDCARGVYFLKVSGDGVELVERLIVQ